MAAGQGQQTSGQQTALHAAVSTLLNPTASPHQEDAAALRVRDALMQVSRMLNALHFGNRFDDATLEDVVQDAMVKVLQGAYNPSAGSPFVGWARRVLKNALLDLVKKRRRELSWEQLATGGGRKHDDGGSAPHLDPHDPAPGPAETAARNEPFCQHDLEVLASVPVRDRIILLVLAGMHRKVPAVVWAQWCSEAKLPASFPPPHLDHPGWEHGRATALAQELGVSPAVVHAVWSRKKRYLLQLKAIQELRENLRG